MDPHDDDRWPRVEALFERALDLARRDRDAFLVRETLDDPTIAEEVRALLDADIEAGAFFDRVAQAVTPRDVLDAGELTGPYRVLDRLGAGGMGTVYRARRVDGAFEREVALKVFRTGGGDVRRFLAERQTLARLDHPSIARLYDGGVTSDGRPYFAMELVEGQPITTYADTHELDVDDRLRLFQQVCEAVQFAHSRLVVHRDLKPSNVMVAEGDDGAPRVKLLDFGIAKVLDDPDLTVGGSVPRTPAYAAPEQVRGEEVTTATDVYALGVLLYELLTGRRPYRAADERAAFERAILETEPTRPSTAVSAPTESDPPTLTLPAPSERLARRLAGDLDQILLKALRKEPPARYRSPEAFGRDIERHLDGLPVEARPESVGYRMGKFVRRHRGAVAAASVGLSALVVGLGVALWQGQVAAVERDRAERASAFMVDLLGEFDPTRASGGRADPEAVLDQAVERIDAGLVGDPAVQAQLYDHVGQIYQTYARFDDAERLIRRALDLRRSLFGEADPSVVESLNHLAWLCFVRGDYDGADSLYARALAIEEAASGRTTNAAAASIEGQGLLLRAQGAPQAAIPLVREALAIREAAPEATPTDVASTRNALAALYTLTGRHAEAVPLLEQVVAERRATLGRHVHTAQALTDYGAALVAQSDFEAAAAIHREALAIRRERLGDSHPHVAQSLSHIGWALQSQARAAEAEPLYREALAIRREHFGEDHTAVGNSLLLLGEATLLSGDVERGLGVMGEAVRAFGRVLGEDHSTTLSAELRLAAHLDAVGRPEAARPLAARLLPQLREAFGPEHDKARQAQALAGRLGAGPS
ncbi:MAG: serine/threonine-protein kinase [Bacteroidota bacterium]